MPEATFSFTKPAAPSEPDQFKMKLANFFPIATLAAEWSDEPLNIQWNVDKRKSNVE